MAFSYEQTYFRSNGKYQHVLGGLIAKVPLLREANGHACHPKLSKFRHAQKCYYDFYNNFLHTYPENFQATFGFDGRWMIREAHGITPAIAARVEEAMDTFVQEAAVEQGLMERPKDPNRLPEVAEKMYQALLKVADTHKLYSEDRGPIGEQVRLAMAAYETL